jgi:plasmid replication initiation protein
MSQSKIIIPENGEVVRKLPERSDKGNTVVLSNDLVRAIHQVNLSGKRLLAQVISRLDSMAEYKVEDTETVVTVSEWNDLYPSENPWRDLKAAADNIFKAEILMDTSTEQFKRYKRIRWCSVIEYCEKEARVVVTLSRPLLPHITGLKQEFTRARIEHTDAMKSLYAWRLYELLMQWKSTGCVEINIETLHKCLEVPPSCIANFGAMRRRVLAPAIKEIEKCANLNITWNPRRAKGRKIGSVLFGFTEKKQQDLFSE